MPPLLPAGQVGFIVRKVVARLGNRLFVSGQRAGDAAEVAPHAVPLVLDVVALREVHRAAGSGEGESAEQDHRAELWIARRRTKIWIAERADGGKLRDDAVGAEDAEPGGDADDDHDDQQ